MTTPVVLITGALTGIGRATALAFARDPLSPKMRPLIFQVRKLDETNYRTKSPSNSSR